MVHSFRKKYSWDIYMYDCTNRRGSGRVLLGFRQLLVYHKTSLVEADHQRVLRG